MTAAVQRLAPGVPFGEGLNLTAEMMATRRAEKAPAREAKFEPWNSTSFRDIRPQSDRWRASSPPASPCR
jgi:hypothetical protein